jgi:hypothetical protein
MTLKLKRSSTPGKIPLTSDLELGQLALNTNDGKLFAKRSVSGSESVFEIGVSSVEVGHIHVGMAAPTTGTWLETGAIYDKATYPDLAEAIGDIPDFGDIVAEPQTKFSIPLTNGAVSRVGAFTSASDGTTAIISGGPIVSTTDGVNYKHVRTGVPFNSANNVQYINGRFMIAGASGMFLMSSTASDFQARYVPTTANIHGFEHGATKYVAYTSSVANIPSLWHSTDAVTWTPAKSANSTSIYGLALNQLVFGNSTFVAVGNAGICWTSSDGATWTSRTTGTAQQLNSLIYANSLFVAVGASGSVVTSPDGITWTVRTAGSNTFNRVIYANSLFVAVGANGAVYTSADGFTWALRTTIYTGSYNLASVVWNETNFIAVGSAGCVFTGSSDGTTWTNSLVAGGQIEYLQVSVIFGKTIGSSLLHNILIAGATQQLVTGSNFSWFSTVMSATGQASPLAYDGVSTYLAVGRWGSVHRSTNDGADWQPYPIGFGNQDNTSFNLSRASYLNGRFFAYGTIGSGTNLFISTTGGTSWTSATAGSQAFSAAVYGAGVYVAVGAAGAVFSSSDASTWTSRSAGAQAFRDAIYANSLFVAVGAAGAVYTSPDGATWTSRSAGAFAFNSVIFANSLFVAVGAAGAVYTSPDGATWTARTSNTTGELFDIAWSGSLFCAVGASGSIVTSPDGLTWTRQAYANTTALISIAWGNGVFVVVPTGINSNIWISSGGIDWVRESTASQDSTQAVSYLGGKFRLTGDGGLQRSADGYTWTTSNNQPYILNSTNRLEKLGGKYFASGTSGVVGVFQSEDGINYSPIRQIPRGYGCLAAYSGSVWLIACAATPISFFRSTDGSTWVKSASIGTGLNGSGIPTLRDLVYANGNFICTFSATLAGNDLTSTVYTSPDGITWTPRYPTNGFIPGFLLATDGTTVVSAGAGRSDECWKSSDGGVTWSLLYNYAGLPKYADGLWFFSIAGVTNDLAVSPKAVIPYATLPVVRNGYYTSLNTSGMKYFGREDNALGFVSPMRSESNTMTNILATLAQIKPPVVRGTTVVVSLNVTPNYAYYPYIVAEFPLYSYNTSTQFWVPPYVTGTGQKAYIYAGP